MTVTKEQADGTSGARKLKDIFLRWHSLFYGLICIVANVLAVLSSGISSFVMLDPETCAVQREFVARHSFWLEGMGSVAAYGVPVVLCVLYTLPVFRFPSNDRRHVQIQVNLPGAFALRGISGWICSCLIETVVLLYLKSTTGVSIAFSLISSVTSHFFLATLSFTLIYFTLETLNRSIVLPFLYPEGKISDTERLSLSSIRSMFFFYFFSAAVFPTAFMGIRLFCVKRYGMELVGYKDFAFTFMLLGLGLLLTLLLSRFFQRPLKKLTGAAKRISLGDYECRTLICSNDELGVLGDAFNEMASSLKEKEFMRDTFGKLVTPQVRDYLLKGNVELGGQLLDVTVMFCDIRGFTSLSEAMKPGDVVALLNEYFTGLEKCISEHGGVINKYIGDAVMALFGAPLPCRTHARDAFAAACAMREELAGMNELFAGRGLPRLRFGIGLHSGPVLAGNIGAASRMEYTVIGDTVNTASRIEGLCKQYGRDLLISQSTAGLLGRELNFVAEAELRGRKEKVCLYTDSAE